MKNRWSPRLSTAVDSQADLTGFLPAATQVSSTPRRLNGGTRTGTHDQGSIPLIVVCRRHSFNCWISHGGQRVLDLLNDKSSGFLRVTSADLSRRGDSVSLGHLDEAVIPKASIDCVLLQNEQHEAPVRRQHSLVIKHPCATFLLLPEHELCGATMWAGRADPLVVLSSDSSAFFPVSPATLWDAAHAHECVASTVAFVNKASVSMMSIGKRLS